MDGMWVGRRGDTAEEEQWQGVLQQVRGEFQVLVQSSFYWKVLSGQFGSALEWCHWIGHKKPSTAIGFLFFYIFFFEYLKRLQSYFIQKWIKSHACLDQGLYISKLLSYQFRAFCCLSQWCGPSSIFVWITEYCIQTVIRTLRAGNYSGLDCRLLVFLIQRTIVDSSAFLEHIWRKRLRFVPIQVQPVCFLNEAAQNFEVFSKIQN